MIRKFYYTSNSNVLDYTGHLASDIWPERCKKDMAPNFRLVSRTTDLTTSDELGQLFVCLDSHLLCCGNKPALNLTRCLNAFIMCMFLAGINLI